MLKQTISLAAFVALTGLAQASDAALDVTVDGLKAGVGTIYVSLCSEETFMRTGCEFSAHAKVEADSASLRLEGVPPGRYAVAAWWDVNDNREMERGGWGEPLEPTGASNGAIGTMGPPLFKDAAIDVPADGPVTVTVR